MDMQRFTYLWDGSQPGWVLQRFSGNAIDLSLTFAATGPSNQEMMAVRRTIQEYASAPLGQLIAQLRGRQTLPLGRFDAKSAHQIAAACRDAGLHVLETVIDLSRCIPVNELTGHVLAIEDDALAQQVHAAALAHGIAVRHVEG